LTEHFSARGDD